MSATIRTKLACASCTRRKVRCSKTVPCTNCVRRSEQDSCTAGTPDRTSPGSVASPPVARRPSTSTFSPETELEYLRRRVAELEEVVQRDASAEPLVLLPSPVEEAPTTVHRVPADPSLQSTQSATAAHDSVDHDDSVMKDAASILECLAWGRRQDHENHPVVSPDATTTNTKAPGGLGDLNGRLATSDTFDECSQISVIQLLLPSPRRVWQLVDYHEKSLLWYHGSYLAPTFRAQLETFYARHEGCIDSPGVDLQWVALLFSIMTASLTCAPPPTVLSWGFRGPERKTLSKRWFHAVNTCLNRAGYATNLSILSCQAIATNDLSAHLLGFSNSQSVHLAAAIRIAQSLALHRLGSKAEEDIGYRVWCQLCSQDWSGVPSFGSYLVRPADSTPEAPADCCDVDVLSLPEDVPTGTTCCRGLAQMAAVKVQLQHGLTACNTAYTRYGEVLASHARIGAVAASEGAVFRSRTPMEPGWPSWGPWANRALVFSSNHEAIMIHQSFLLDSFNNPAFAYTRKVCITGSQTIVKEYKCVVEDDGPVLWIHQAFSITASIVLLLDALHRDPAEREWAEHRQLAEDVLGILSSCHDSRIAVRGARLLRALLGEVSKAASSNTRSSQSRKRKRGHTKCDKFDVPRFVRSFCEDRNKLASTAGRLDWSPGRGPQASPPVTQAYYDPLQHELAGIAPSNFNFSFPWAAPHDTNGFESLLYLANHDGV